MIGETIGHYQVTGKLGEGAMGEVYEATDTQLKRRVALKTLSSKFAADGERVARLRREAEVLASLNHAHIAQIYGLESTGQSLVLVLELVEGPTLADRIERGPVPRKEALRIAHQIAAALELAHESGIIHRDLKPANVKLTPDGDVKVLDFGLAKGIAINADRTDLTVEGAMIGTPAYMSPEQVEGRVLDRRTDIWSFGCVLYELLTGTKAFDGDSVGSLFAAIATAKVDPERVADAPAPVRRLIERCLRKNPKTRLRDIGDARIELEEVLAGREEEAGVVVTAETPRARWVMPAVAALLLGGVVGALIPRSAPESAANEPAPVQRFSIGLPSAPMTLHLDSPAGYSPPLAVSPDGQSFVFAALDSKGVRRLYMRTANDARIVPLDGSEEAESPFFSPDGTQVGFGDSGGGNPHRISLADKTVKKIVESWSYRGATWLDDDTIVYAPAGEGLTRVPLTGGTKESLTQLDEDELDHRWPQALPGRRILFTAQVKERGFQVRLLALDTGAVTPIDIQGNFPRYLPGYLLYMLSNDLWAVPFDLESGKTTGQPRRVVSRIHVSQLGNPHVAVSASGVLVYEPTRPPSPGKQLVWVDREGKSETLDSGKGYEFPRLSPDGKKVSFAYHTVDARHDVWTLDLERRVATPLTAGRNFVAPVWSPDGNGLMFSLFGPGNLHAQRLDETEPRVVLEHPAWQWIVQWREPGRVLIMEAPPGFSWDILELDLNDLSRRKLIATAQSEQAPTISPDGKWLAYVSFETGQPEVYVKAYPKIGPKVRVSREGGVEPCWSPTGKELFLRRGRGMYAVSVPQSEEEGFGKPELLFEGQFVEGFQKVANYDVSADGNHFVMVDGGFGLTANRLEVHLNFLRELELAFAK